MSLLYLLAFIVAVGIVVGLYFALQTSSFSCKEAPNCSPVCTGVFECKSQSDGTHACKCPSGKGGVDCTEDVPETGGPNISSPPDVLTPIPPTVTPQPQ